MDSGFSIALQKQKDTVLREIEEATEHERKIVIVYQMGKVASSSYSVSLSHFENLKVFHVHRMNPENNLRMMRYFEKRQDQKKLEREMRWRALHDLIVSEKCNVDFVTGVRDPIARNISAFFQNLSLHDFKSKTVQQLHEEFNRTYPHELPLRWFDQEFRVALGVNVFDRFFDKEVGWSHFAAGRFRVLSITMECEDRVKEIAVKSFFALPQFHLTRTNTAEAKEYADTYREFLGLVRLTDDEMDRYYTHRVANHFYDDEMIERFRQRWRENRPKNL